MAPAAAATRVRRIPVRTCVGCRRSRPKPALLRLARTPGGVRHDPARRLGGRGAYLCRDLPCIEAAAQRDAAAVSRALRGVPAEAALEALAAARAEAEERRGILTTASRTGPAWPEEEGAKRTVRSTTA